VVDPQPTSATVWTRSFVTVLVAQMAFGYSGSTFLLLPKYLSTQLGASPGQIGHVTAISSMASVVAIPFVGGWIDRVGRKPLISIGCGLSAVYAGAWLFVDQLGWLVDLAQVVGGVAVMIAFNAASTLVADQAPRERLGQAIGIFGAANMAMGAIAPAVAEVLAVRVGWRAAFGLATLVALGSLALSRRVHEHPRPPVQSSGHTASVGMLPLLRRLAFYIVAMTTAGAAYGAVYTYYQPFVLGQGATRVSGFFVGFTLAAVSTRVLFGALPDRVGRRRAALGSYVLYACMVLAMTQLTPSRLLVFGFLFGYAHGVFYPTLSALFVEHAHPDERGRVMTLVMGSFRLGNVGSALALGWVAEHYGYRQVFVLAALGSAIGVAALALQHEPRRAHADPTGS
jgi:MFS family permease